MITIDGSYGEGGGQIIRTALALSIVTGQPFTIERIRAGRKNPGLQAQHLAAVKAATEISGAHIEGAAMGSQQLTFVPGKIVSGQYSWRIGTAGSTTLVLQTVLAPLILADGPSELTIEGGTHAKAAPPFNFLEKVFLPAINRIGPRVSAKLVRYGFYPPGGGEITVRIEPASTLSRLHLDLRGALVSKLARSVSVRLPRHIGEREVAVIRKRMKGWHDEELVVESSDNARSPGNFVSLELTFDHVTEVFTSIGERGVTAEAVAEKAVEHAQAYLSSNAAVGPHIADQLLVPMALAGRGSFTTNALSLHTTTNIDIIRKFLESKIQTTQLTDQMWRIEIGG